MRGIYSFSFLIAVVFVFGARIRLTAQSDAAPTAQVMHLLQLGSEAMHRGNVAEAEIDFKQAVAAAPELADAYLGLGLTQLRQAKLDDAAKSLEQAAKLNPQLTGAHMFLGIAKFQMNKLDEAVASLHAEVALQPKNVEVLSW